jgi:uncharacterized protein (TIGR02246 family)
MRTRKSIPIMFALPGILVCGLSAIPYEGDASPGGKNQAKQPVSKGEDKAQEADREAIRKSTQDFLRAFEKGDAKAVASFWTEQGEYVSEDGAKVRGRAAIARVYAKVFARAPKQKAEVDVESIRFVSKDNAIEEGYVKIQKNKTDEATSSRYSILHVREGGRWLMAILREWPSEGVTLRDVEWLIGTWVSKTEDGEVRTTYQWDEGKAFIRVSFTIQDEDRNISGTQMIGRDPRTGNLRSWLFERSGGFGEGTWARDGKRWVIEATGVHADGSEMTATNILTPLSRDSFTWQSTQRTSDGEELPNIPPVRVTRVK